MPEQWSFWYAHKPEGCEKSLLLLSNWAIFTIQQILFDQIDKTGILVYGEVYALGHLWAQQLTSMFIRRLTIVSNARENTYTKNKLLVKAHYFFSPNYSYNISQFCGVCIAQAIRLRHYDTVII